jgi:hypothetical protein
MGRLRRFIDRTYSPRPAKWKRLVLLVLSFAILVAVCAGGWVQLLYRWTNDGVWLVLILFGVLGIVGLLVSVFGSDDSVALVLGRPDF